MLIAMDQSVKMVKLAFEIGNRCGGDWGQIGEMMRRKRREAPDFPLLSFQVPDSILPSTLLSYMSLIESRLHPLFPASPSLYSFELRKIVHWLYHELILRLHSAGYYELHRYLQRRYYSAPTLEEEFIVEFKEFLALGKQGGEEGIPAFPVFSCNWDYLKALFAILENQIIAFETLHRDYLTLLDTFLSEIEGIATSEAITPPEEALIPPRCYTPPQLPSFLMDKSEDIDVEVLFPDEYTFRNRELAKELREITKTRPDLDAISTCFRDKWMEKRWFGAWNNFVFVKNRQKTAVAQSSYRRNRLKTAFSAWKMIEKPEIGAIVGQSFAWQRLALKTIDSFRLLIDQRRSEQHAFTHIYHRRRLHVLSTHFSAWKSSIPPCINPVYTTPAPPRPKSPSLMCELDNLMSRLKTTETKLASQLQRWKPRRNPSNKKGKAARGNSLSQQQVKLHRTIKEMSGSASAKSKVGV